MQKIFVEFDKAIKEIAEKEINKNLYSISGLYSFAIPGPTFFNSVNAYNPLRFDQPQKLKSIYFTNNISNAGAAHRVCNIARFQMQYLATPNNVIIPAIVTKTNPGSVTDNFNSIDLQIPKEVLEVDCSKINHIFAPNIDLIVTFSFQDNFVLGDTINARWILNFEPQ